MASKRLPAKTVHAIDFSTISGNEFERLVLAFAVRRWPWDRLDWFGQKGNDGGRDLSGVRPDVAGHPQSVVIACANWGNLTITKAKGDLAKIASACDPLPEHVLVIAGGAVPASVRSKVEEAATRLKIDSLEVWSGVEFEEQLRHHARPVLERFFAGEELPDDPDLARAPDRVPPAMEAPALAQYRALFERPAFETPFRSESNLPNFRRALTDVIEALNTGIARARDGTVVQRIPCRFAFESRATCEALADVVRSVNDLRAAFDEHHRAGAVRPCGCGKGDCPVFMIDAAASRDLDARRRSILARMSKLVGAPVGRAP
ncbi:MAG: hypothetical protein HYV09_12935 [Deltaproteobacteria bacterium]|nr:hypothetical protein [Deltaproteobacteria bacterium]